MNQPIASGAFAQSDLTARFSTDEFVEIFATGALSDIRLELVDGSLYRMSPPLGPHSNQQTAISGLLWSRFGSRTMVEAAIDLGADTIVVCDVALLLTPMTERRFLAANEVLLAIEIAGITIDRDLGLKRARYAAAAIPHYWVIDLDRKVLHRFTEPTAGEYLALASLRFGEAVPVPGTSGTIVIG